MPTLPTVAQKSPEDGAFRVLVTGFGVSVFDRRAFLLRWRHEKTLNLS